MIDKDLTIQWLMIVFLLKKRVMRLQFADNEIITIEEFVVGIDFIRVIKVD